MADEYTTTHAPPLSTAGKLLRLGTVGVLVLSVIAAFGYFGGWFTPHRLTPAKIVDAFEQANGLHPGFRRNHAKGVCVSGFFEGNGSGSSLSKSTVFETGRVPVVGRFALAGGKPYQADAIHTTRSMALLFSLPGGQEWRTGMNNTPVFPVNTLEGFYEQLVAVTPDPESGKADPAKMKAFLVKHPESVLAIAIIKNHPVSTGFFNDTFNSLNAFYFVNEAGISTPVRWAMVPVQPFEAATTQPANADKNYLFDGLIAAIHHQPLQWHLIITVGELGDKTNDATIAWPADRQHVDVGTLTIDQIESEETSPVRDINFDPLVLPTGILPSDDPLLSARSAAYSQSVARRDGEAKQPSAITPQETGK